MWRLQLSLSLVTATSMQVNWIEVAENGVTGAGQLATNELRYGTSCPSIVNGNFSSGTQVTTGCPCATEARMASRL